MLKASRVLQLMENTGRKRKWVASKCGISLGSLNHALNGRRPLSLPVVMLMSQILETPVEDIWDYQQPKTAEVQVAS